MKKIYITILISLLVSVKITGTIWFPPKISFFKSDNNRFLLKVIPQEYYTDDTFEECIVNDSCVGILYEITRNDTIEIWSKKLINKTCPVNALISNDGKYIVSFFDWYCHGINDIVIYEHGEVIRSIDKQELLECLFYSPLTNNWLDSASITCDDKIMVKINFYASIDKKLTSLTETLLILLKNGVIEPNPTLEELRKKSCNK